MSPRKNHLRRRLLLASVGCLVVLGIVLGLLLAFEPSSNLISARQSFDTHAAAFHVKVQTYRATVTETSHTGTKSTSIMEVTLPDSAYFNEGPTEEIHIGGRHFSRFEGVTGVWVIEPGASVPFPLDPFEDNDLRLELGPNWLAKVDVTDLGFRDVSGSKCNLFILKSALSVYTVSFCFTSDDLLASYESNDGRGNSIWIEYTEFNSYREITEPDSYVTPTPIPFRQ